MSVEQLELAAQALGELVADVVFLGGATVGLWFTDPAAGPARVTFDVDVVAEVFTPVAYERFQAALRAADSPKTSTAVSSVAGAIAAAS